MWCSNRVVASKPMERSPSPWLEAFVSDKPADQTPTGPPREVLDLLRRLRDSHSGDDPAERASELLTDLHQWRSAVARAARIKPSAVLKDSTLRRIAQQEPSSISELSAVIGPIMADRFGPRLLEIIHPAD